MFIMSMYIPLFHTQGIHVTVKRGDIEKKREREKNTCMHLLYIFICLVYNVYMNKVWLQYSDSYNHKSNKTTITKFI